MKLDAAGWLSGVRHCPSPHWNERPTAVDALVIHNISLPPQVWGLAAVEALFLGRLNPAEHPYYAGIASLRVSAHFAIGRGGDIVQFVATEKRAWHAGLSSFQGRENWNDFSIGVELNGSDHHPYTLRQYQSLARLLAALRRRYPALEQVVGHSDIAPGRKSDPGEAFHWPFFRQLAAQR